MDKTILIIDDDPRNIFALSAYLRAKGLLCIAASNMVEAFSVLESNPNISIILMDMMMPGMDGYEAIPVLKASKEYAHIPIISITAQAMPGDKERCLATGADGYVSKPVDIDLLQEMLNQLML